MASTGAVNIRAMTLEDIPGVIEIDRLSFPIPWPASSYHFELTKNSASTLLVAERSDQGSATLLGYVGSWLLVDEVHISTIAVHPSYRSHGIAHRLLTAILERAQRGGARLATLEVRVSNTTAINLYEAFGFHVNGLRPRYYRDNNEDAHIMTLTDMTKWQARSESDDEQ